MYDFYESVDDSTNLGKLFNRALKATLLMRIASAPKTFEPDSEMKMRQVASFYDSCLIELYLHSVVRRLQEWKCKAIEYCAEFDCNWEYYAAAQRLESTKKYGGDKDDYDENGNIVNVGKGRLKSYSIVSEMKSEDSRDIFMDTTNDDLKILYSTILVDGNFSIQDIFKKATGKTIATYRQDENGDMVQNTFGEEAMHKVNSKVAGEDLVGVLVVVFHRIHELIKEVKKLKEDNDNREFFTSLLGRIDGIFDLKMF